MIENWIPDARRATASPPPLASLTTRMFLEEVFSATQNRLILTRILPRTVRVVSLHTLERGSWQKTGWSFWKPSRDKLIFPLAVLAEEALPRTSPPHDHLLNSLRRGDPPGIGTQPRTPAASSSPPATPSDPSTTSKIPFWLQFNVVWNVSLATAELSRWLPNEVFCSFLENPIEYLQPGVNWKRLKSSFWRRLF